MIGETTEQSGTGPRVPMAASEVLVVKRQPRVWRQVHGSRETQGDTDNVDGSIGSGTSVYERSEGAKAGPGPSRSRGRRIQLPTHRA